jgi:hypothetical protein
MATSYHRLGAGIKNIEAMPRAPPIATPFHFATDQPIKVDPAIIPAPIAKATLPSFVKAATGFLLILGFSIAIILIYPSASGAGLRIKWITPLTAKTPRKAPAAKSSVLPNPILSGLSLFIFTYSLPDIVDSSAL